MNPDTTLLLGRQLSFPGNVTGTIVYIDAYGIIYCELPDGDVKSVGIGRVGIGDDKIAKLIPSGGATQ